MKQCKCGSYAINLDDKNVECDVCLYKNLLDLLMDSVENVCEGWSWFPEDGFGSDEAIISSHQVIHLQNAMESVGERLDALKK